MKLTRQTVRLATLCLALLATLVLLAGCGKRGALVPPEALVPAPITDLSLAQRGTLLQVSWSAPTKEEGGAKLKDLAGFILLRHLVQPVGQDCDECPGAYTERARVGLDYLKDVTRLGDRFLFDDYDLKLDQTYRYKVRSISAEGAESRDSNRARRKVFQPPLPPVVEASTSPTAVVLSFVALASEQGKLAGYNIFRANRGQTMPLTPLNPRPVTANTYADTTPLLGSHYSYAVRTVAEMPTGEFVESALSNFADGELAPPD
jgi:predicted small lipoprotein YifL